MKISNLKNVATVLKNRKITNTRWFNPSKKLTDQMIQYFIDNNHWEKKLELGQVFNAVYGSVIMMWHFDNGDFGYEVGQKYKLLFLEFLLRQESLQPRDFSFEDLIFQLSEIYETPKKEGHDPF